jgi:2-iminobutanoate/2-iminopropanoate deaminase
VKRSITGVGIPAAIGPYSPAVAVGNELYCSGQLGLDPETGALADGVAAQAEQAVTNLGALLTAAGFTYDDIVKTTIFLVDLADFATVNEIYGRAFTQPYPARSTIQVAALPKGGLVEIEAIAKRGGATG